MARLSERQILVLEALAGRQFNSTTPGDVTRYAASKGVTLSGQAVATIAASLFRRGLILRRPLPRQVYYSITDDGMKALAARREGPRNAEKNTTD